MVLAPPPFSRFRSQRTSLLSLSWTIHELRPRHEVLAEAAAQSFVAVVNEVQHNAGEEAPFNGLVKAEVVRRLAISTMITVVEEVAEVVGLAGKTMTSRNETVILRSTSVLSGR